MEYYNDGQHLSDNDRAKLEKQLLEEYLENMDLHYHVIKEALEYLLTEMGNDDILRAHDDAFTNKDRR